MTQTVAAPEQQTRFAAVQTSLYATVTAVFVGLLLISNIGATKLIEFGPDISFGPLVISPIITDGGAFLFPLVYIVGDILSEVYGFKAARRAIWTGFAMAVLAVATFYLVMVSPAAEFYEHQEAFEAVLGFFPRIVIASLAAYIIGQLLNAWVLVKIKERTKEKKLWLRLIGSTFVGEAADTIIFCTIAFAGIVTGSEFFNYVFYGWAYKVLVEVVLLPVTYAVIRWVKTKEPTYTEVPLPH